MSRQHSSAGFTLIELMIVVAIIAVLAAIAIPAYQDYLNRTALVAAMSDSAPYREAVAQFGAAHQAWPTSIDQVGLAAFPGDRNVSGITLGARGVLTVDFVSTSMRGHALQLTPYVRDQQIHWSCGGDVPAKLLPADCKQE